MNTNIRYSYADIVIGISGKQYKVERYYGYGKYTFGETLHGTANDAKFAQCKALCDALSQANVSCIIQMHTPDGFLEKLLTGKIEAGKYTNDREQIIKLIKAGNHKIMSWNGKRSNFGKFADEHGIEFVQVDNEGRTLLANGQPIKLGYIKPENCKAWPVNFELPKMPKTKSCTKEEKE